MEKFTFETVADIVILAFNSVGGRNNGLRDVQEPADAFGKLGFT